jgi:hypothetical protein
MKDLENWRLSIQANKQTDVSTVYVCLRIKKRVSDFFKLFGIENQNKLK